MTDKIDKKPAISAKDRQAKRRDEMESRGYKTLSLGFVHTRYHQALKKLAKQIDEGGITDDLKIKTVRDKDKEKVLENRITELESLLKSVSHERNTQGKKVIEQSERVGSLTVKLERFKQLWGRLHWLR